MTINPKQLAGQVVIPTLQMLEEQVGIPYTDTAFYVVMGTIANESMLGTWLVQEDGPALGIGQIEPVSLRNLVASLTKKEATALASLATPASPEHNVVANLPYAVAIVRLYYWKIPVPLPAKNSIADIFAYYKHWYNTAAGAATMAQFKQNWALTGIPLAVM